jgi:DNA-binding transcriptional LysR family regulator
LFLRVFSTVYEERSVYKAAERLSLTPSAVSHSLRKLRLVLGDELFIREGGQMTPTPRTMILAPLVDDLLHQMRNVLYQEQFDPETSDRTFAVASLPYSTWLLMTRVTAQVVGLTSNVRIKTYPFNDTVLGQLEDGVLDVAVGNFLRVPDSIERVTLFTDRIVWVMRKGHPLASEPMTTKLIAQTQQLKVDIGHAKKKVPSPVVQSLEHLVTLDDYGALQDQLTLDQLTQSVRTTVPDIVSGFAIVSVTDLLMPAPATIASVYADHYGLRICDAPYGHEGLDLQMIWHKEHGRRDSVAWLRRQMIDVAKGLP